MCTLDNTTRGDKRHHLLLMPPVSTRFHNHMTNSHMTETYEDMIAVHAFHIALCIKVFVCIRLLLPFLDEEVRRQQELQLSQEREDGIQLVRPNSGRKSLTSYEDSSTDSEESTEIYRVTRL